MKLTALAADLANLVYYVEGNKDTAYDPEVVIVVDGKEIPVQNVTMAFGNGPNHGPVKLNT